MLAIIAILCFTTEIVFSCLVKQNYLFSFFFWLDVISTVSLLFDISFIFGDLLSQSSG